MSKFVFMMKYFQDEDMLIAKVTAFWENSIFFLKTIQSVTTPESNTFIFSVFDHG